VLVVGALAFDYLSPATLWTIVPPLLCVLALVLLRRWGPAALVVALSSWVAIPTAAGVSSGFDAARGTYRVYDMPMAGFPAVDDATFEGCIDGRVRRDVVNASAALARRNTYVRRVVRTFIAWHNHITIERAARHGWRCGETNAEEGSVVPEVDAAFIEIGGDWRYSPAPYDRHHRGNDRARVLHIDVERDAIDVLQVNVAPTPRP
jgi:hypothetical protein